MKTPGHQWSWRTTFKNATSQAGQGAVSGAIAGLLDPTGASAVTLATIGAGVGFLTGIVGDSIGYLWDDEPDSSFASLPLFSFVVGMLLATPLIFVAAWFRPDRVQLSTAVFVIAGVAGLVSTAAARLADDIYARYLIRRQRNADAGGSNAAYL